MLASLGHPKFGSVVTLLVMNTFATVWGAAGTHIYSMFLSFVFQVLTDFSSVSQVRLSGLDSAILD